MQLNILFLTLAGASLITAQQGLCDGSIISTDGSFGDNQLGNEICCQGDPNHGVGGGATTCTAGTPIPMTQLVSQTAAATADTTTTADSSTVTGGTGPLGYCPGQVWMATLCCASFPGAMAASCSPTLAWTPTSGAGAPATASAASTSSPAQQSPSPCNGSIISTDGSFGDNQLGNEICCQGDLNHGIGAGASTCTAGNPIPMSSLVSQTAATASSSSSRASANVAPTAGAVWIGLAGAAAAAGVAAL